MSFSVKNIIFGLFGAYDKSIDSNKDVNGKGTMERFNEGLAEDLDEQIVSKINTFIDTLLVPRTMDEKYIPYLEENLGGSVFINTDVELRRKLLESILTIYPIRGTSKSYEVLFRMLGVDTLTINELEPIGGFDSIVTFDSNNRTFDSSCPSCSFYELIMTGSAVASLEFISSITNVRKFLEPINAKIFRIEYNGVDLPDVQIVSIFVDESGNIVYDLGEDGTLSIVVDEFGDLVLEGDSADHYFIDDNGDLIYKIVP